MDDDDDFEEATLCETLRDDQAGVDAIDIFLGVDSDLIFVTDITDYICGEKSVMWRNFRFL